MSSALRETVVYIYIYNHHLNDSIWQYFPYTSIHSLKQTKNNTTKSMIIIYSNHRRTLHRCLQDAWLGRLCCFSSNCRLDLRKSRCTVLYGDYLTHTHYREVEQTRVAPRRCLWHFRAVIIHQTQLLCWLIRHICYTHTHTQHKAPLRRHEYNVQLRSKE